jgi:hypothetical protein
MWVATPGMIAPAETVTKPAINEYSMSSGRCTAGGCIGRSDGLRTDGYPDASPKAKLRGVYSTEQGSQSPLFRPHTIV